MILDLFSGNWGGIEEVVTLDGDDIIINHNIQLFIKIEKIISMQNSYLINIQQFGKSNIKIVGNIIDNKLTAIGPTNVLTSFEVVNNQLIQTFFGFTDNNSISGTATLQRLLG